MKNKGTANSELKNSSDFLFRLLVILIFLCTPG